MPRPEAVDCRPAIVEHARMGMMTFTPDIRLLERDSDAGTLHTLYDTVLTPSFLPAEREPLEKLSRRLAAGELHGAVATAPDGEPVGALFVEWFADIRASLMCYFAVRPDLRGQGIGRRLVAVAGPHWRATLKPHVVLAEAEDPATSTGGDHGDGDARLRLYAGFGARRVPVPYLLPELMPGAGRMSGLMLLVVESDEVVSPAPDRIRSGIVDDFVVRYFARMEDGAVRDDDSRLQQLLAECRRTDFLPLLAL